MILIFQAPSYKNKIVFRVNLNFDVDLTLISWPCFDFEIWLSFQHWLKDFNISSMMIWEQNCFQSQPKINVVSKLKFIDESTLTNRPWINVNITLTDVKTLFQHISTLNQHWVFAGYICSCSIDCWSFLYKLLCITAVTKNWF